MRSALLAFAVLVFPSSARAADRVDYARDIKPLLVDKCYSCHGAWKQKAKLRVETVALLKKGGRSGPAVMPGKPTESAILAHLTGSNVHERMPPEGEGERLTAAQIATVRRWIEEGAIGPDEPPPPDPREHWAFRPPVRPPIPPAAGPNPIDRFLAARHQQLGLIPEPEADRHTLLRRVTIDLTGLPPTPEDIRAFLADTTPDAYEKVVDRLLASPRFGERWGRHWLDVWRYSDWSGENNNQVRGSPKHIWRWRDWVIENLNADTGYDGMLTAMLAGDEAAPHDPSTLRATGFLARNYYKFNRNVWLDDTVEHTAKAFLGLTVACSRCHDHKFDPVSQTDYYRLRAVFEPHQVRTEAVNSQRDSTKDGLVRVFDRDPLAPTYLFRRGDEAQPDREHPLTPGVPEVFGVELDVKPVAVGPSRSTSAAVAGPAAAVAPASSTGRRLAFARWLTDGRNPLTARVAVNHVWLRHFGTPLVEGVADFGLRSPRPRHAELLDFLACEFRDGGWSLKKLHRLIVTSTAYRRRSDHRGVRAENVRIDAVNQYFWRANARRLEAEAVRDGVLAAAGSLDLTTGGPEIPLTDGETSRRRGVYFRHAHERQVKFLEVFDAANPLECYRRPVTVVPQQALALFNSPMVLEQSRVLTARLPADADGAFVAAAFLRVLGRPPTAAEAERCRRFLADQGEAGRESLVHTLFNHPDFVTVR
jgi:hypothetical protein